MKMNYITKQNWTPHSPEALAQICLKRDARIRAWTPLPQPMNTTMSTNLFVDDVRSREWTPLELLTRKFLRMTYQEHKEKGEEKKFFLKYIYQECMPELIPYDIYERKRITPTITVVNRAHAPPLSDYERRIIQHLKATNESDANETPNKHKDPTKDPNHFSDCDTTLTAYSTDDSSNSTDTDTTHSLFSDFDYPDPRLLLF